MNIYKNITIPGENFVFFHPDIMIHYEDENVVLFFTFHGGFVNYDLRHNYLPSVMATNQKITLLELMQCKNDMLYCLYKIRNRISLYPDYIKVKLQEIEKILKEDEYV